MLGLYTLILTFFIINIFNINHVEITQFICIANQWTGFYMRRALAWKKLIKCSLLVITIMVVTTFLFKNISQFILQCKKFRCGLTTIDPHTLQKFSQGKPKYSRKLKYCFSCNINIYCHITVQYISAIYIHIYIYIYIYIHKIFVFLIYFGNICDCPRFPEGTWTSIKRAEHCFFILKPLSR